MAILFTSQTSFKGAVQPDAYMSAGFAWCKALTKTWIPVWTSMARLSLPGLWETDRAGVLLSKKTSETRMGSRDHLGPGGVQRQSTAGGSSQKQITTIFKTLIDNLKDILGASPGSPTKKQNWIQVRNKICWYFFPLRIVLFFWKSIRPSLKWGEFPSLWTLSNDCAFHN